jgi:hypothetical protein
MLYSSINSNFNNTNIKDNSNVFWDDFNSDYDALTHNKAQKVPFVPTQTFINNNINEKGSKDMDDCNNTLADYDTYLDNNTAINSKSNNNNIINGTDISALLNNKPNITHRECIKKYFNLSSSPFKLETALSHIKTCSICQDEIERIYKESMIKNENKEGNIRGNGDDIRGNEGYKRGNEGYKRGNGDDIRGNEGYNGDNEGYNGDNGGNEGYIRGGSKGCNNCNIKQNPSINMMNPSTNTMDILLNKINELTNKVNILSTENKTNDLINYKVGDIVHNKLGHIVHNKVEDIVASKLSEMVNNKKLEHFTQNSNQNNSNQNNSNQNNNMNMYVFIGIVIIIILLLIDIYMRIKKE